MSVSELVRIEGAARAIRAGSDAQPRVGLVLGSGLGAFAESLQGAVRVPFGNVPGMPTAKIEGHAGNFVIGEANGVPVVAMQGRVHLYEGHDPRDVVLGIRAMISLGARTLVITNAAGGIDAKLAVGDLMVIDDHLNLTGTSSLLGANDNAIGPRFPDMTAAYDPELRGIADGVAKEQGFTLPHGVYAGLLGPAYETPAEIRMLRTLGAHAVGMSTVLETIAARHMGARVLGISCITNLAAGLSPTALSHDEVKATADRVRDRFIALLGALVVKLGAR